MDETSTQGALNPQEMKKPSFFAEFSKEFVSALVVIPIIWILARLLHVESEKLEFVAAPVILAWFAVRGWKTEDATWPGRLPLWKFIPKFLYATLVLVGLPLLAYSIASGWLRLLEFHDPPYLLIFVYAVAVVVSGALIWIGRETAVRLGSSPLGLSQATVAGKARFGFYWLVSLGVLAIAVWPEGPAFDTLCNHARRAGADMFSPVPTSLEGMQFLKCAVRRQGEGYAVTLGAVSRDDGSARLQVIHFRVILYSNGETHHFERVMADPRDEGARSGPKQRE